MLKIPLTWWILSAEFINMRKKFSPTVNKIITNMHVSRTFSFEIFLAEQWDAWENFINEKFRKFLAADKKIRRGSSWCHEMSKGSRGIFLCCLKVVCESLFRYAKIIPLHWHFTSNATELSHEKFAEEIWNQINYRELSCCWCQQDFHCSQKLSMKR